MTRDDSRPKLIAQIRSQAPSVDVTVIRSRRDARRALAAAPDRRDA